jgi:hypothetical protein
MRSIEHLSEQQFGLVPADSELKEMIVPSNTVEVRLAIMMSDYARSLLFKKPLFPYGDLNPTRPVIGTVRLLPSKLAPRHERDSVRLPIIRSLGAPDIYITSLGVMPMPEAVPDTS